MSKVNEKQAINDLRIIDRVGLRCQIPRGFVGDIAIEAGVSRKAVSDYFAGNTNSERVERAALIILARLKKEKTKLIKAAEYE